MSIGEIVKDSLKYPLSNWKKFLILGIFIIFNTLNVVFQSLGLTKVLFNLGIFGLFFGVLISGYEIRILKSSLAGFAELPQFNDWFDIIINGIFVIIVGIAYAIPLILIMVFGGLFLGLTAGSMGINNITTFFWVLIISVFLYLIIILPIFLMSLANMAFYDSELGAAFKFREIFNKISNLGWHNFIIWYIITGIICLIVIFVGGFVEAIFNVIQLKVIGVIVTPLILLPYMNIYLFRSTALFYLSESQGYLECEKCGGYYELQPGESPKDFEKCQCGGNLRHVKQLVISSIKSEDITNDKHSFREKLNNKIKWTYIGYGTFISILITLSGSLTLQHMPLDHEIGFILTAISLILSPILGAFIASYSSNTYKNGLLNGLLSIFLFTILIFLYDILFLKPEPFDFYSIEPMFFLMFGPIGSLTSVFVKKNISKSY
jgi:hypothetical protein